MKADKLSGYYVRQNGKIFPWGMIRVLCDDTEDNPKDNASGLALWSSKLTPYGNGKFYAKIIENSLVVIEKKTGNKVSLVHKNDLLISPTVKTIAVVEMGYIFTVSNFGGPLWNTDWSGMLNALRLVEQGQDAPYVDNSSFVKVSKDLVGSELVLLNFQTIGFEPDYKIFTFEGELVPFSSSCPLKSKLN